MIPLWRIFDAAKFDPKHYHRGLEIQREMTMDDGDDYETHMKFETRQDRFI